LILFGNVRGLEAAMAFIAAVVLEAATLARKRSDEFYFFSKASFIELLPEKGTPAALLDNQTMRKKRRESTYWTARDRVPKRHDSKHRSSGA
jgi:hypothetical protein